MEAFTDTLPIVCNGFKEKRHISSYFRFYKVHADALQNVFQ